MIDLLKALLVFLCVAQMCPGAAANTTSKGEDSLVEHVTFAQFTDAHIFDDGWKAEGSKPYWQALDNRTALHWAVEKINELVGKTQIDFVVYTGDFGLQNVVFSDQACNAVAFRSEPGLPPFSSRTAVLELAVELDRLRVHDIYVVPGNNDIIDEQVLDNPRFECFIAELQARLQNLPGHIHLEALRADKAVSIGGFRLAGLNTASFKYPKNYAACDTVAPFLAKALSRSCPSPQIQALGGLLDEDGTSPILLFTHVPDLIDPYKKERSWEIDKETRRDWVRQACKGRLVGIFAGHFHSNQRDLYATNSRTQKLFVDPCVGEKTWVAPPLAGKNQRDGRAQARGFMVLNVEASQGRFEVEATPVWYPGRTADNGVQTMSVVSTPGGGAALSPQETPSPESATKNAAKTDGAPASRFDEALRFVKAIQELISGILGSIGWALVTLIVLIVLRVKVGEVLQTLVNIMHDRGVTVDVGTVVKLQVAEPPADGLDDRKVFFSPSPFEIDDEIARDGSTPLREIAPQLKFQVSDYVGRIHEKDGGEQTATRMREARDNLTRVCESAVPAQAAIRAALEEFAKTLEASRFLEANRFVGLLAQFPFLRETLDTLAPSNVARDHVDFVIINAAGVAYAQMGEWKAALKALDRIALKDDVALYPPAGAFWLACKYHDYIEALERTKPEIELDSSDYVKDVIELAARGGRLVDAIRAQAWAALSLAAPKGYYLREALKDRGNVLGIAAEYAASPEQRRLFYSSAEADLIECSAAIEGEPASPLDHNNLADLYRQRAEFVKPDSRDQAETYYAQAHDQVDEALRVSGRPDPAFYDTRARVFFSEQQPLKALQALDEYGESDANRGDSQDVEQYVENQILGAKLLFALTSKNGPPDLARITCTLEHARAFLEHQRIRVGEETADELQGGIEQLLGFAYLGWREHEPQAIAAFDRLFGLRNWSGLGAIRFRCWLCRAKAQTRWARTQRRQFSRGAAALMRKQAAEDLAKVATLFDAFDFGAAVPKGRRQRNLRLRLDAGIAFQALAEEQFAADETVDAKGLCEKGTSVLVALYVALEEGGVGGDDPPQIRKQVQQCKARLSFLSGLIAIREDPSFKDDDLIQKVKNRFDEARGINTDLDCRIDLALGELLLVAARLGKGDNVSLYREAIVALERAAGRDVPLLRADTILALASAYAARGNVLRRPKASATVK